jgi:dephospho-CoA kinase
MIKVAITGNIGTGKTTVSKILKLMRYKVFESDKEVKKILKYKKIITRIKDEFVHINKRLVTNDGHINNTELGNVVFSKKLELQKLEKIIHPEIWKLQDKFLKKNKKEKILFFDIPLLFEKKLDDKYDYIFYTYVPFKIQKKRVLQRENMSEERFNKIWRNQVRYSKINKKLVSLKIETNSSEDLIRIKIKQFLKNILI